MTLVETVRPLQSDWARISPKPAGTEAPIARADRAVDLDKVLVAAKSARKADEAQHVSARRLRRAARRNRA